MRIGIHFTVLALAVGSACAEDAVFHARVDGTPNYGERVPVVLCIANSTSLNMVIPDEGVFSVFSISLTDSAGNDVKRTTLGRKELVRAAMPNGRTRVIPPGEQYCVSLDLNLIYDMNLPGNYCLEVNTSYSLAGNGKPQRVKLDAKTIQIRYRELRSAETSGNSE